MKFRKTEELELTLSSEAKIVLNETRKDFNSVLGFINNAVKDEINKGKKEKLTISKIRALANRALTRYEEYIVESALDHFLFFYKQSDFDYDTNVHHRDDGFSLKSGFRFNKDRNSFFLKKDKVIPINVSFSEETPITEEMVRVRFLDKVEGWFVQIEYFELEGFEMVSSATSKEDWLEKVNKLNLPKTSERFYKPELTKMTTNICSIVERENVVEFLENATKVSAANFNVLVQSLLTSFDLKHLRFFRESEVLKLFTKLKNENAIREFEIPDSVARGVCREVSTHINHELKKGTKNFKMKDVETSNFFIVTSNRMFVDKMFNRIVFVGAISIEITGTERLEDHGEAIAVFFKEEGKWKVQLSQHNQRSREDYKMRKKKMRKKYEKKNVL